MAVAGLQFHHTGCLTEDIERSLQVYRDSLGFNNISPVYTVTDQEVKVCFIETGPGVFVELVEPLGENASLKKILKSRNPYYHIAYLAERIDETIKHLEDNGFYLVNKFHSEAFDNRLCAFMYTSEMHLIELIEK